MIARLGRALGFESFTRRAPRAPWNDEESILEELFSVERLEQHARSLAAAQTLAPGSVRGRSLSRRLRSNETVLLDAYRSIAVAAARARRPITPAAEWLLDNYHLVEAQIREIRDDLPPGYYRELPKLSGGPFAGYPRVFGLAWAFVAHTDSRIDADMLRRFVRAYQHVEPLTIGELWSIAITLRIVLVENLRRAARRILIGNAASDAADALADALLAASALDGAPIQRLIQGYEQTPLAGSFAVRLVQRLRDQDPKVTPALAWLDGRLAACGKSSDEIVDDEHRHQGATNVTVRNIITSMRLVSDLDWPTLVEEMCLVDDMLRSAPPASGVAPFAAMDFQTRNLYRSAIETLGRGSGSSELAITQAALRMASRAASAPRTTAAACDPGYYLIGAGRRAFESSVGFRARWWRWPSRFIRSAGIGGYVAAGFALALALLSVALALLANHAVGPVWLAALGVLGLIPAVDAGVALANRALARGFAATTLPGLALREGIPADLRTLVAVPILLTSPDAIDEQVTRLEVHHLANPDREIHFALLSDWIDATSESAENDALLLDTAVAGIARLNERYAGATAGPRFLLLHRQRVWNDGQARWIGWERKRGKLHELNRLLRGATDTTFVAINGPPGFPPVVPAGVRYVVTLDADTRMPRETVRRLVGKMAHPLNRPQLDPDRRRVVSGYGVLQPRVTPSLPIDREGSLFQRIFSSMSGIDPYAAAVSDVYQDLFGEGSYSGKGIYDIDAFEAALGGRVHDSTLLSHDLFEGTFARAGLASDIELVESFPARYDVAAARHHRWVRGDWQLLPWLFGRGDAELGAPAGTSSRSARLPMIGRWKMLDNLRRSLSAPASLLALVAGFLLPFRASLVWTAFILMTISLSTLLPLVASVLPRRARTTTRSHLVAAARELRLALSQVALLIVFLAHQAWSMIDAIGRTLVRLFVTRLRLLDWVTAAQASVGAGLGMTGYFRLMQGAVLIALATGALVWWAGRDSAAIALPFILAWIASPAIARWASLSPPLAGELPVADVDRRALRLAARRTWRYFETFVTATDHMLPPDNFQQTPVPTVAHRTSPTNIGLYLLAAASARDFGWIGTTEMLERLEATIATMLRMARFRGHFYNWYDTGDLRPLDPQYISSVDSGNLAGHLIALANALTDRRTDASLAGIEDALLLTREALEALPDDRRTHTITRAHTGDALDALARALAEDAPAATEIAARLAAVSTLATLAATMVDVARTLADERIDAAGAELLFWAEATERAIGSHRRDVDPHRAVAGIALERRKASLAAHARRIAAEMDFEFLLDRDRRLLSIGYRVGEGVLDPSCYDLLASEARLASFIAIAKGDVPSSHWFRLGRSATPIAHRAALVSWSGSMFEYLMPSLVMRAPAGSLLEQTSRLVVRHQIEYATGLGVPWGISESAFNLRDLELTYQYSNFGIPVLGLKRGLGESLVIAPYASALAAMVDPAAAATNFARLVKIGARGRFGFYEALDFTRARVPEGQAVVIVEAFMAHHQGMTIVAIANALLSGVMRARFHAEPIVQATELLLHERTPRDVAIAYPRAATVRTAGTPEGEAPPAVRRLASAHPTQPQVHLLSNGRYTVMLTDAGSGYSRSREAGITRWREDPTCDDWGSYIFLRDVRSGKVWSAGYQPTGVAPDSSHATFAEDRAEFVRVDGNLTTTLEVVVSPEDDAEVRRVSIANAGNRPLDIELTSYAELVLAPPAADTAHPAFSKLFVQTEYLDRTGVILATRRRRAGGEREIWAAHLAVVEGDAIGGLEIETDRARFIGRGRSVRAPVAVMDGLPLSNTVGTVLDPVFALRRRVRIPPGGMARVAFWTVVADSRRDVIDLADKHREAAAFDRAGMLSWTRAQVQLGHLGIDAEHAILFQRLAGALLYADRSLRSSEETIRRGAGGPAALWSQGISGDLPIIVVRIHDVAEIALVRELLHAQEYWRMKQLAADLVIINERPASYIQDLQLALETLVRTSSSRPRIGGEGLHGGVFVLRADLVPAESQARLLSIARVVLFGRRGGLLEQLDRLQDVAIVPAPMRRMDAAAAALPSASSSAAQETLEYFNGLGGFARDGREYVTTLGAGQATPAPWINVIANPSFGFQVAAEGSGYTWSENSRENQLTPWSNDPISDRPGESIYVRDEETGELWGPTAAPIRDDAGPYVARHGQGYSRFAHAARGIELELLQYVPLADPVKISRLVIRNTSGRVRRLAVTGYIEWVLGASRAAGAMSIATEIDTGTGALFARNPWNATFGARVAFMDLGGRQSAWTGDRREFIGRHGSLESPAALARTASLSRRVGAGLDACGALQTTVELKPGGATEVLLLLGESAGADEARTLIERYRTAALDDVLADVVRYWDGLLGTVQVRTPDRAMDIALNRWLLYQVLACRMWARAAFYQASGAFGFRDQLQDGMALAVSQPAITRAHLLRAAGRQFVEGDVQHWWLPPTGQGVRTRIADDRIWLAYAVAQYIETTGDVGVLEVPIPFLDGPTLQACEHDAYFTPTTHETGPSLFEHCARGIDQSLALGAHGLPLIGGGDWNDGMNRVGERGRGESVWLGWFLHATIAAFARIVESAANRPDEADRIARWTAHAAALRTSLEHDGWDGAWYRRGFFDDGTPLGSSASDECRIDSIAQSWAVISGAGDPARARIAMSEVEKQLIPRDGGLALLFAPPFDRTPLEPGYIKGYPPGIRENGGQYTHGAVWSVIAFAAQGEGNKAAALFALLNPIHRTTTRADVHRYKVEPYAVAADVYSVAPHSGRGGWTWYTGAAGWMYRAGLEAILGFKLRGAELLLEPRIPTSWPRYEITFAYRSARYEIAVENPAGKPDRVVTATLDDAPLSDRPVRLPLIDDGAVHRVRLTLG